MATSRERNLQIKITGDTSEINAKLAQLSSTAESFGAELSKQFLRASDSGKKLAATLTYTTNKLSNMKGFVGTSSNIVGGSGTIAGTTNTEAIEAKKTALLAKAQREREAQQKATSTRRLAQFKKTTSEMLAIARLEAQALGQERQRGADSRYTKAAQNALKLKQLETKLGRDLQALANKFAKAGADGRSLSGKRSALLNTYKQETAEIHKKNAALATTATRHKAILDTSKSWVRHVTEIVGVYRLVNFGINTIIQSIKSIPKIGIDLQTTEAVLESTMGSSAATTAAFKALEEEASRTGIALNTVRENFRNLNASMSLAGENTSTIYKVFTDLNTVSTALHLSQEKTQAVFLAIAQIFNKTKVQSEELVKQLGNLLPGAFASFAAATGRSTRELAKQMQLGLVTAHDDIVAFTDFMAERFSEGFAIAEVGLQANIGRMQTSFLLLGETIFKVTKGPMINFTKAAASMANSITEVVKQLEEFSDVILTGVVFAIASLTTTLAGPLVAALASANVAAITLKTTLAFFLTPARIIAGITAVAFALSRIGTESKNAREDLQTIINKVNEVRTAPKIAPIDIQIDNTKAILEIDTYLNKVAEQVIAAEKASSALANLSGRNKAGSVRLAKAKLTEEQLNKLFADGLAARGKLREIERSKILIEQKRQKDGLAQLLGAGAEVKTGKTSADAKKEEQRQVALQKTKIILMELQGFKRQAASEEIRLQTEIQKKRFEGNAASNVAARHQLDLIEQIKLANSEVTFNLEKQTEVKTKLAVQESYIKAERQAGLTTELQAYNKLMVVRKQAISTMQIMLAQSEQRAINAGQYTVAMQESFTKTAQSIKLLKLELIDGVEKPLQQILVLGEDIRAGLTDSLGDAFYDFITGAESAEDAMANFAMSVLEGIAEIAAAQASQAVIGAAVSGLTGTAVGGLFGLAKGGAASGLSAASGTVLSSPTYFPGAKVKALASGGVVAGEAGDEVVLPLERDSSGTLGVKADVSASGGNTYNTNVYVQQSENESAEDTGDKIALQLMKTIARAEIANANRKGNQSNKKTSFA